MSISITLKIAEPISLEKLASMLDERIGLQITERSDEIIGGVFEGGDVSILKASPMTQRSCHEMYDVKAQTVVDFGVDKFSPYDVSYGNILKGVIALVKATQADAIAAVEGRPFLRRINGKVTLYNHGGLFAAEVRPQWRELFDFDHALQERFER